jgi:hypothetical protein
VGYEPVGRIRPVAPAPSLLTAARPLPGNPNWSTGIQYASMCQPSYGLQYCPPAVDNVLAGTNTMYHSMPFTIYTPISCDYPEVVDVADLEGYVNDLTEIHTAAALAAALWAGTSPFSDTLLVYDPTDTAQPTLRRYGQDVSSAAGALDLDDGISTLLVHYSIATGGNGGAVVHLPQALIATALGGGPNAARTAWPEGNTYRAALGSVVSPGPGYPEGSSPPGPKGNGPKIGAGENYAGNNGAQSWIYVTGPVEYAVTPIVVLPEAEQDRIPFRLNRYQMWGRREAIVRFDPCACFATLVVNPAPMPEVS